MAAGENVAAGRSGCHESTSGHNNASNNFTCEFMDLDQFFAATAAAVRPLVDTAQTRSREENNQPCILNTRSIDVADTFDSEDTSCSRQSDEINNEIQEVPHMSIESSLDGGSTNSCATKNTSRKQKSGRKSSRRCANSHAAVKDNTYWDRRVKNNIAAKRSRDAKRLKEVNVVERWKFLEKENKRLKKQLANMKERRDE